jgi:hypothetical protein
LLHQDMPITHRALYTRVWSALTGRHVPCACTSIDDLRVWLLRYARRVLVPTIAAQDANMLKALYGRVRSAREITVEAVAPRTAAFPCAVQSLLRVNAAVAGMLFVLLTFVKPDRESVRECAVFLPEN